MKIFVIVEGPTKDEMVRSLRGFEDGSPERVNFFTHSSCGKEQYSGEFQIIDLPNYIDGAEIFEFTAIQVEFERTVEGMYNSQNSHGYLSIDS